MDADQAVVDNARLQVELLAPIAVAHRRQDRPHPGRGRQSGEGQRPAAGGHQPAAADLRGAGPCLSATCPCSSARMGAKGKLAVIISIPRRQRRQADEKGEARSISSTMPSMPPRARSSSRRPSTMPICSWCRPSSSMPRSSSWGTKTLDDALTIPSEAINDGQDGQLCLCRQCRQDGRGGANSRHGLPIEEGGPQRHLAGAGEAGGDVVVTDGQLRLAPGMKKKGHDQVDGRCRPRPSRISLRRRVPSNRPETRAA